MKPERALSTAWWNVVRRKMRATPAEADESVRCPDCDGPMFLMEGRFGRFYKCEEWGCQGTHGAHLDGRPRQPRNVPPELLEARQRAARAVRQLLTAVRERVVPDTTFFRSASVNIKPDIEKVIWLAELGGTAIWPIRQNEPGLHLRKRTIEECRRVEAAANKWRREKYPCAWDHVGLDGLEETG
jgi:ssDNA-binding Zn-finger/Zn-ribbon topoisomerase 1